MLSTQDRRCWRCIRGCDKGQHACTRRGSQPPSGRRSKTSPTTQLREGCIWWDRERVEMLRCLLNKQSLVEADTWLVCSGLLSFNILFSWLMLTSAGLHLCFDIAFWTWKTYFTIPLHALSDVNNPSYLLGWSTSTGIILLNLLVYCPVFFVPHSSFLCPFYISHISLSIRHQSIIRVSHPHAFFSV